MNEEGKSFFSYFSMVLFLLLFCFSFVPYADLFKEENITRLVGGEDFPEKLVIFMGCAIFFGLLWFFSYLGSGILSLLVHLGFRLLFLFKLRKPMLLYTGDPDYKAPECDCFSKLDKAITSVKSYFNSKRWVDISFYMLCIFCTFILLCMTYAEGVMF